MSAASSLYIGLMSGTSADGIDAVAVEFDTTSYRFIASHTGAYNTETQQLIKTIMQADSVELDTLGQLDIAIGEAFANTAQELLDAHQMKAQDVVAIGSHGQTLRHLPPRQGARGFSLQAGDPSTIAALTDIDVIADFRQADMAQGGHGAPLAPAFHQYVFGQENHTGVLNLGGIANVTVFTDTVTAAWDTGPASTLMDAWILRHKQQPYDDAGNWASTGTMQPALLQALLSHPYFSLPTPKSTGLETFNLQWLDETIATLASPPSENDVQATLLELTAQTIANSIATYELGNIIGCGGGVHNQRLMSRLRQLIPQADLESSDSRGIDPQTVEAMAFAWLAWRHKEGLAGNITSVTGAARPAILGGGYPRQK